MKKLIEHIKENLEFYVTCAFLIILLLYICAFYILFY